MPMSEEAKAKRNEYMRKWRKANADKVKKNAENYWERKAKREADQKD